MYNQIAKVAPVLITASNANSMLSKIPTWSLVPDSKTPYHKLQKTFKFKNYESTWAFLNQIAMRAHLLGHHPTIKTTYSKVEIELNTHDLDNRVSDVDIKLASKIDSFEKLYTHSD